MPAARVNHYNIYDKNYNTIKKQVTTTEAMEITGTSRTNVLKSVKEGRLCKGFWVIKIEGELKKGDKIDENYNYPTELTRRWDKTMRGMRVKYGLDLSVWDAYKAKKDGK